MHATSIPGAFVPVQPRKGYRLRQAIEHAAASAAAVDLLRELALGNQPERPLTAPPVPRWAASFVGAC